MPPQVLARRGTLERFEGALPIAQAPAGNAQPDVGVGVSRIELQRLTEFFGGRFPIAFLEKLPPCTIVAQRFVGGGGLRMA